MSAGNERLDKIKQHLAEQEYLKMMRDVPVKVHSKHLNDQPAEQLLVEFKSITAMFATVFNVLLTFGAVFAFVMLGAKHILPDDSMRTLAALLCGLVLVAVESSLILIYMYRDQQEQDQKVEDQPSSTEKQKTQ